MYITKSISCIALVTVGLFSSQFTSVQAQVMSPSEVEVEVREAFSDIPVMIEIARCESKFRQFTDAGNVLRGGYGDQMIGVFQFYESVHEAGAAALGYDLATVDGNLAYARYLYNDSGTTAWDSSRDCWSTATQTSPTYTLTTDTSTSLTEAELREKIALLQQLATLLQTLLTLQMNN